MGGYLPGGRTRVREPEPPEDAKDEGDTSGEKVQDLPVLDRGRLDLENAVAEDSADADCDTVEEEPRCNSLSLLDLRIEHRGDYTRDRMNPVKEEGRESNQSSDEEDGRETYRS